MRRLRHRLALIKSARKLSLTKLGPKLAVASLREREPLVTRLRPGTWLVQQPSKRGTGEVERLDKWTWVLTMPGRRRRVIRQVGPDKLRASLVIDEFKATHRASSARLHLMRHLCTEHVVNLINDLDINVVLDVGANRGQYALELRENGYTGRIVSFEPVPESAAVLAEHASHDPQWQVHQCALGDADDTLEINVAPGQGRLSSLLPATDLGRGWGPGAAPTHTTQVPVRRLQDLFDDLVSDVPNPRVYLKLDTQGYDPRAFAGAGDRIRDIAAMQSEVSILALYDGMPHYTDQLSTYENAGFGIAGLYPVILDQPSGRVIEFDALLVRTDLDEA